MNLACLHTASSNVAVFEAARRALGVPDVRLRHAVRADLLDAAESGAAVLDEAAAALCELAVGADAVLLTCSTLGPAAEAACGRSPVPVLRADAALARKVAEAGGRATVLVAAPGSLAPTRALFEAAASPRGTAISVRLVPEAWAAFRAGEHDCYAALIAAACVEALAAADRVALAQVSMAAAAGRVAGGARVMTSPAAALAATIRALA